MSIRKQFVKTKPSCRVIFNATKDIIGGEAKEVHLVGDFNEWDTTALPMKRKEDGSFSVSLDLEQGRVYQFRYLIDQARWENDLHADRYAPTPFGNAENSVVVIR